MGIVINLGLTTYIQRSISQSENVLHDFTKDLHNSHNSFQCGQTMVLPLDDKFE